MIEPGFVSIPHDIPVTPVGELPTEPAMPPSVDRQREQQERALARPGSCQHRGCVVCDPPAKGSILSFGPGHRDARVVVDGTDITNAVVGVDVAHDVHSFPIATVKLLVRSHTVDGKIVFQVDDETAKALLALGWQPPDAVCEREHVDDEEPPCWHTEPGTSCDFDVCNQPERLAAGDRGSPPFDEP